MTRAIIVAAVLLTVVSAAGVPVAAQSSTVQIDSVSHSTPISEGGFTYVTIELSTVDSQQQSVDVTLTLTLDSDDDGVFESSEVTTQKTFDMGLERTEQIGVRVPDAAGYYDLEVAANSDTEIETLTVGDPVESTDTPTGTMTPIQTETVAGGAAPMAGDGDLPITIEATPGFGPIAAIAGLAGAAGLRRWAA
jgi:PGF-CTERM protein